MNSKMKTMRFWRTCVSAAIVFLSSAEMRAQSTGAFVSFLQFLSATTAEVYNSASMPKVANAAAFAEMRQHILSMYQGVKVTHSFVVGSQIYDCIPIDQQPSVRLLGLKSIAAVPPASGPAKSAGAPNSPTIPQSGRPAVSSTLSVNGVDRFGNIIGCQDETVPIGRTTLAEMIKFPTLKAFLSKSPDGKGLPPVPKAPTPGSGSTVSTSGTYVPPSPVEHLHDYTYQWVYNLGGHSTLSINDPYVYTPWGEVFSLSQVWYIGFNGGTTQTVEAGWQVFPDRLGDEQPHLFAYWTADGYNNTGCYDYTCGAFVQYSGSLFLGAAISPISVPDGAQYEIPILWEWWAANWWLQVNGTWVGYYPGWLFGGGDMATHSDLIEFGGEIVGGNGTSYNYYPPIGDGYGGTNGWPWAAYQRQIWYMDGSYNGYWTSLGSGNECTGGSSILGPYWGGSDWGIYFFFGGPGGWC